MSKTSQPTAVSILFQITRLITKNLEPDGDTDKDTISKIIPLIDPWPMKDQVFRWYVGDASHNRMEFVGTYDEVYEFIGDLNEKTPCLAPHTIEDVVETWEPARRTT